MDAGADVDSGAFGIGFDLRSILMVTEERVLAELSKIIDPDFQRDIVSLGFVQDMVIDSNTVAFTIELTTPACPLSPSFSKQAIDLVGDLPDVER